MTLSTSETIAAQVQKELASGLDPFGDNDPLEVEGDEAGTVDGQAEAQDDHGEDEAAAAASGAEDQTATTEATSATAAETTTSTTDDGTGKGSSVAAEQGALDESALRAVAGEDDQEPDLIQVEKIDFKAKRAELTKAEQEIDQKWTEGSLTDAERNQQMADLRDRRDALTAEQSRNETIQAMNASALERHQLGVLRGIATASKAAGQLDYSDAKVGAAFDGMLRAVASDPANEGKNFRELAQLAHEGLCAVRGVRAQAAAPAPAPAAAAKPGAQAAAVRTPPKPPITLRDLPTASTPHTGGDAFDALSGLKGQDYQAAFDKLSPAQKQRLLDE
ncbi:hypothetical protein OU995_21280 [Roseateles sp. SL47]|uniref:hypothetical protein n=1 Tax=Roseateles sp. SL47 TaxID=2995138 RepID=UPI00226EC1A2|nr:hypothetical protein [Roseateles sp. SL47]WAC72079.1 hypothetical protein OU995_21280 [Roseateles sp. SL47]